MAQFKAITPQLFTSGQNAKVFLGEPFRRRQPPPTQTITLSGAVSPGQTSLTVTALSVDLHEGTPLPFEDGTVYLADFAPVGSTEIIIANHDLAIAGGSECVLEAWIPLFSVKTFTMDWNLGEITDNTCDKLETDKAIAASSKSVLISGPKIFGDPGMEIINSLQNQFLGYKVKTFLVKALGRGAELVECYFAKSEQVNQNSFDQVTLRGIVDESKPLTIPPPTGGGGDPGGGGGPQNVAIYGNILYIWGTASIIEELGPESGVWISYTIGYPDGIPTTPPYVYSYRDRFTDPSRENGLELITQSPQGTLSAVIQATAPCKLFEWTQNYIAYEDYSDDLLDYGRGTSPTGTFVPS